jgi:molecular chaperone DnaK
MVKEAEAHADDDRKRREEAETRNSAEQLVYSTEKFVADNKDKLPESGVTEVQTAIDDLKKALTGSDVDEITTKHEALAKASQTLGSALYNQGQDDAPADFGAGAAGASGAAGAGTAPQDDDEVVDAEIVDDEEK